MEKAFYQTGRHFRHETKIVLKESTHLILKKDSRSTLPDPFRHLHNGSPGTKLELTSVSFSHLEPCLFPHVLKDNLCLFHSHLWPHWRHGSSWLKWMGFQWRTKLLETFFGNLYSALFLNKYCNLIYISHGKFNSLDVANLEPLQRCQKTSSPQTTRSTTGKTEDIIMLSHVLHFAATRWYKTHRMQFGALKNSRFLRGSKKVTTPHPSKSIDSTVTSLPLLIFIENTETQRQRKLRFAANMFQTVSGSLLWWSTTMTLETSASSTMPRSHVVIENNKVAICTHIHIQRIQASKSCLEMCGFPFTRTYVHTVSILVVSRTRRQITFVGFSSSTKHSLWNIYHACTIYINLYCI